MIIDFNEIPVQQLDRFKDGEKFFLARMSGDPFCTILHGTLVPGASIGLHTHEESCEIMYFLHGNGRVLFDGGAETVAAGQVHYCPKGHAHSLVNDGAEDLVFLGIIPKQ